MMPNDSAAQPSQVLAPRLGLFGATMAVIGGIVGAGIFINPYLVAQRVHTAPLILLAWICGGVIALIGGAIDEIDVRFAVETTKERVGKFQHVLVPHLARQLRDLECLF